MIQWKGKRVKRLCPRLLYAGDPEQCNFWLFFRVKTTRKGEYFAPQGSHNGSSKEEFQGCLRAFEARGGWWRVTVGIFTRIISFGLNTSRFSITPHIPARTQLSTVYSRCSIPAGRCTCFQHTHTLRKKTQQIGLNRIDTGVQGQTRTAGSALHAFGTCVSDDSRL